MLNPPTSACCFEPSQSQPSSSIISSPSLPYFSPSPPSTVHHCHCSSLSLSLTVTVTVAAPTGDAWSEIREEFKSRAVFRMKEQLLEATAIQDVLDKLLFLKLMHFDHLTGAPTQVVSQLMLAGYTDDFDYFYQVISALFVLCLSIGMSASLSLCEAVCLSVCLCVCLIIGLNCTRDFPPTKNAVKTHGNHFAHILSSSTTTPHPLIILLDSPTGQRRHRHRDPELGPKICRNTGCKSVNYEFRCYWSVRLEQR